MTAKVLPFPVVKRPERELLRVLVNENTGSVRCPRKGPLGAEISILVCEWQHKDSPRRCAEEGCDAAKQLAPQIQKLKAHQKSFSAP